MGAAGLLGAQGDCLGLHSHHRGSCSLGPTRETAPVACVLGLKGEALSVPGR